ncbi:hypothetical protein EU520_00045 [Candidatus Thorarchaeota archaeon]|nr:MAG: hypothetical protein EU520_00045 [Candidatus Thorarchaeota archaeon]
MFEDTPDMFVRPSYTSSLPERVLRYFIHGIAFFFATLFAVFLFAFLVAGLTLIAALVGLVLSFGIYFVVIGALNSFISEFLWDTEVPGGWGRYFGHGLLLFILLLLGRTPLWTLEMFFINLPQPIYGTYLGIQFVLQSTINGYVAGKTIAILYGIEVKEEAAEPATEIDHIIIPPQQEGALAIRIGRTFIHGIPFVIFVYFLGIPIDFIIESLPPVALLFGLGFYGFLVLSVAGFLNTTLLRFVWAVEIPTDLGRYFGQGLLLVPLLIMVHVPFWLTEGLLLNMLPLVFWSFLGIVFWPLHGLVLATRTGLLLLASGYVARNVITLLYESVSASENPDQQDYTKDL